MPAPWDELAAFDLPREMAIVLAASTATLVLPANPQRVFLAFAVPQGASNIIVSTTAAVSGSRGVSIANNNLPWELFQSLHGPLVAQQWYAFALSVSTLTIIEVTLSRWPLNLPGVT